MASAYKRGVIIGNCQTSALAKILNSICSNLRVSAFQVHLENDDSADKLKNHLNEYDFILSMPLSNYFKGLSFNELSSLVKKNVRFITNIYFSGLHPDFVFLGSLSERYIGPVGNYHSKIVLGAFLLGITVNETLTMFCNHVYESLGYYNEFVTSKQKLVEVDERNDIKFAGPFFELTTKQRTLLTFNHPSTVSFVNYATMIAAHLAEFGVTVTKSIPTDLSLFSNELVEGPALPIYPEIAKYFQIPYEANYIF